MMGRRNGPRSNPTTSRQGWRVRVLQAAIIALAFVPAIARGDAHETKSPATSKPSPKRGGAPAPMPTPAPTTRAPAAGELAAIVRTTISNGNVRLPKGATITSARPTADASVPIAPSRVTIELTAPARRAGKVTTMAVLVFWREADVAGRLPIAVDLMIPPEALVADVPKGAAITLVVQRGEIEVSAQAVAGADADIGDVVQVLLRPSGRAFRARIVARDRAIAVEDAR